MPAAKKPTKAKPAAKRAKSGPKTGGNPVDRSLSLDQLSQKLRDLRGDLIRQLNQIRTGSTTNVRRPRHLRRQIARHLTVINERRRQPAEPAEPAKADSPAPAKPKPKAEVKAKPKPKGRK